MDEKEFERLKKELDDLRKNKIIIQAKLKQKEDKITELTRQVQGLKIQQKETSSDEDLNEKTRHLMEDLARSRQINKKLRSENNGLLKKLEETRQAIMVGATSESAIQPVSIPSSSSDEKLLEQLRSQLAQKDEMIASLNDELENMALGGGGSFTKIRQLNAKIRELKSHLSSVKKSEENMKQRLVEMNRKLSSQDFNDSW